MKEKLMLLPPTLKAVIGVLTLEALALVVWAVILVVVALQSGQLSVYASYSFGLFYMIVAISLLIAANAVVNKKRFGRSLAVVWQLFAVILGLQMFFAGSALGLVATVAGGLVLILLFTKPSLSHFSE